MSILTDIPQRKRFDDFSERGAFQAWMKQAIVFAVIICIAALLMVYLMDSRSENKEKAVAKEQTTEQLPVVADLPMNAPAKKETGTKSATKSTKSAPTTTKKATPPPTTTKSPSTRKSTPTK
jgi:cytoskeletal protein RodZ